MTTAEQTEAFQIFSNSRYHVCSKSSAPWPTSARLLFIPCVLWTKIFVLLSFIFLFFDNDFFHALFCRAKRFHNRRSRRSRLHHPQSTSCFIIESSGCRRPGGEAFQCIQCILWFEISCSFVPFVVTENIWLWPTATSGLFVLFVVHKNMVVHFKTNRKISLLAFSMMRPSVASAMGFVSPFCISMATETRFRPWKS